jgi:hypothetical protein
MWVDQAKTSPGSYGGTRDMGRYSAQCRAGCARSAVRSNAAVRSTSAGTISPGPALLAFRVAAALACFAAVACGEHPTDDALRRRFEAHEQDFARLVAMSNEDARVVRIAPDFTRLDSNWAWPRPDSLLGFSRTRWEEYRALFRRVGLESGLTRETADGGAPVVLLTASALGIVNHGSSKGFAYSTAALSPLYPSLDHLPNDVRSANHGVAYRPLRDGWYLELDW